MTERIEEASRLSDELRLAPLRLNTAANLFDELYVTLRNNGAARTLLNTLTTALVRELAPREEQTELIARLQQRQEDRIRHLLRENARLAQELLAAQRLLEG